MFQDFADGLDVLLGDGQSFLAFARHLLQGNQMLNSITELLLFKEIYDLFDAGRLGLPHFLQCSVLKDSVLLAKTLRSYILLEIK